MSPPYPYPNDKQHECNKDISYDRQVLIKIISNKAIRKEILPEIPVALHDTLGQSNDHT